MPIHLSLIRLIKPKTLNHSLTRTNLYSSNSSNSAQEFITHLQNHPKTLNLEKTLNTVNANLDPHCITQVLETQNPQKGIRFFIWAALNPTHRPTSFTYHKASTFFNIKQNPQLIHNVFDEYRSEGFVFSLKMFKVVLNLCKAAKDCDLGLWVLKKMKEFGVRPDTVSYNVVIRLVVDEGRLDEAMGLMREMGLIDLYPDMVTYVSIVKGFCDVGRLEEAFELVNVMKERGCVANAVVYSTLLDGICGHGSLEMALEFLSGMEKGDGECKPNVVSYTSVVKGFVEKGRAKEAVGVLDRMSEFGVKPNRVTFGVILDGLCKEGFVEVACEVVEKFSGNGLLKCDELYSLFVVSLVRGEKFKEAEEVFRTMMSRGMMPNGLASSSVIKRAILEGRVMDGFVLFDALEKSGNLLAFNSDSCSKLLEVLCKENCIVEAAKVVNLMLRRRIKLKSDHAETIIRLLETNGEHDLASNVSTINS